MDGDPAKSRCGPGQVLLSQNARGWSFPAHNQTRDPVTSLDKPILLVTATWEAAVEVPYRQGNSRTYHSMSVRAVAAGLLELVIPCNSCSEASSRRL